MGAQLVPRRLLGTRITGEEAGPQNHSVQGSLTRHPGQPGSGDCQPRDMTLQVCVCVCIYMHICVCVYVCMCVHMYMYVYVHVLVSVSVCVCFLRKGPIAFSRFLKGFLLKQQELLFHQSLCADGRQAP